MECPNAAARLARLMFSPRGRLARSPFWIYTGSSLCLVLGWAILLAMTFRKKSAYSAMNGDDLTLTIWISFPILLLFCWGGATTQIKRLHDRDMSGWWLLLYLPAGIFSKMAESAGPGHKEMAVTYSLLSAGVGLFF